MIVSAWNFLFVEHLEWKVGFSTISFSFFRVWVWLTRRLQLFQPERYRWINVFIIRSNFFFLLIGREPTTWPTNNYLQIIDCSCAMSSNCVWVQIIFFSCVKESTLFSFLRSLLLANGRSLHLPKIFIKKQTRWSNDKTQFLNSVIAKYRYLSLSRRQITIFCSTSSNNC